MIMYHGTTLRAAQRIRVQGFQPRAPSRRVWFAQSKPYAQRRASTKGRRARDRAVVLTCDIDVDLYRRTLGARRVLSRGSVVAITGTVPATVLRSHSVLGVPNTPDELVGWVDSVLGLKRHRGPGRTHAGIQRLARWVTNRLASNPDGDVHPRELLGVAQQWLPDYFEDREVDFAHLRTFPGSSVLERRVPEQTREPDEPALTADEDEALDCLLADKPRRRQRGLELLARLSDPDLFDWCAMYLGDEDKGVRVKALSVMRQCEDAEPEVVEPLADVDDTAIRAAALEVLCVHGGERMPHWFWRGLTDPEPHVRLSVAHHLGQLDPGVHREIFETARHDPCANVARIADRLTAGKGYAKLSW